MNQEPQIINLKQRLSEELRKENSDNNLILSLSNEIARLDDSLVRFSVDAGIINRLGKELVGRHETAVSELVKNAYDADSTEVNLIFENAWNPGGTLHIEDNGSGMNREQLINGFMRLSSSDKIHNPISPLFNRTRAGRKGIGRFATQRLGEKLTIITQTNEADNAIKIQINWNSFETDKDLSAISNSIEYVPKQKGEGTNLIITGLREGWSDAMINRVYRYTSDLLQPFPLSKIGIEKEEKRIDPGFQSTYFRKEGHTLTKVIDEEVAFLKHALAEIEGYVLDDGQGCWALKSEKLKFKEDVFFIGKEKDTVESKFNFIKGVHFKCYYFIYESSLMPTNSLGFIREVANERGGIRLYRNGFRVLPYGEKGNDWVGLDSSVRKRVILPPHGNVNFFGFVELLENIETFFEETSSREGLIESPAFHELTDFVYRSITSAVMKIAELRNRKSTTSTAKESEKKSSEIVDSAIGKIKAVIEKSKSESYGTLSVTVMKNQREEIKEAVDELIEFRQVEKQEKQQLIDENNMLRILAGLGLVIGEFVHEVKNYFPGIDAEIRYFKNALKDYKEALERLDMLETNVKSLTTYSSYFDEAISRNVLRELESIELRDAVNSFQKVIQRNLERSKIKLNKPEFNGFDLYTIPMHPSEWASILFNFYTNSKKAIKRSGIDGELFIKCGRDKGNVYLEFSDNGDGIPKQNEDDVFNAFFTTSSAAGHSANEMDSLTGTGLGLKIVRDIVESYGGSVYVTTSMEGYNTTMRIEIPENKNQE